MRNKTRQFTPPPKCPVCGAAVPAGASACPECGADERTGWDEEKTRYDTLNLPDDSFDYDEVLKDEGLRKRRRPIGVSVFWWITAIGVAVLFIILAVVRA